MNEIREELIAPCGLNCRLCRAYQREKNQCKGCRIDMGYKSNSCRSCIIKNCPIIQSNKSGLCFECDKFPCHKLRQLDKRYQTKYHMSTIENLEHIKQHGIDKFLQNEEVRWTCKECGNIVCVHKLICFACKTPYRVSESTQKINWRYK